LKNSIGIGFDANWGPLNYGQTWLEGSEVHTLPGYELRNFDLLPSAPHGRVVVVDDKTIIRDQGNGQFAIHVSDEKHFHQGGVLTSLGIGVSAQAVIFNGTPKEYSGEFVSYAAQAIVGVELAFVPGSWVPVGASVLFGPQVKVKAPFVGQAWQYFAEFGQPKAEVARAVENSSFSAFYGQQSDLDAAERWGTFGPEQVTDPTGLVANTIGYSSEQLASG
jgi:hypothetical protein